MTAPFTSDIGNMTAEPADPNGLKVTVTWDGDWVAANKRLWPVWNVGSLEVGDTKRSGSGSKQVTTTIFWWWFPEGYSGTAELLLYVVDKIVSDNDVLLAPELGPNSEQDRLAVEYLSRDAEKDPGADAEPAAGIGSLFPAKVDLVATNIPDTPDMALWLLIRRSAEGISYHRYADFMNWAFCGEQPEVLTADDKARLSGQAGGSDKALSQAVKHRIDDLSARRALPFPDIEPYRVLKAATELFLMSQCGVLLDHETLRRQVEALAAEGDNRRRLNLDAASRPGAWVDEYVQDLGGDPTRGPETLPYLALIRQKLGDVRLRNLPERDRLLAERCYGIITEKLTRPCLLELIWSYWHEEGMLSQTINAVSLRFQNRRTRPSDPLANLEVDPLRPVNNLLWGWVQDEQHRLTISRRAHEYDHEYGLKLVGRAVPKLQTADSRSTFLTAFHTLLQRCAYFFKEYDDKTVVPDAFPVLNALREVHLVLSEGAHNQYGDLPWTARQEMLMTQWILARPEFREFLPTRIMVAYPEPWMDRVDAMKKLQGWTDTSVRHFRDLGVTGEKILLSIRFGNWSDITNQNQAANWAIFWREEIQWYINSYEAVTGVDLTSLVTESQQIGQVQPRFLQPAVHLSRKLGQQQQQRALGKAPVRT